MEQTQILVFEEIKKALGLQNAVSTEDIRTAITEMRKQMELEQKQLTKMLSEYEKMVAKLEKGGYN